MIKEASKYKCRYVGNVPHALVTPFWNTGEVFCDIAKFCLSLEMAIKVHAKITSGNKYSAAPSNLKKKVKKKNAMTSPSNLVSGDATTISLYRPRARDYQLVVCSLQSTRSQNGSGLIKYAMYYKITCDAAGRTRCIVSLAICTTTYDVDEQRYKI